MVSTELRLTLPYAPSVNSYWRHVLMGKRPAVLLSEKGRNYREAVALCVMQAGCPQVSGRLAVVLEIYQPTRRECDLDNLPKGVLDGLTHASVWKDDSQIDDLRVIRCGVLPPGKIVVRIRELNRSA